MKFYQRFLPYLVAISSPAIALALTVCLEPFLLHTIGAFFYLAIILTAWYGGWRGGFVAVFISAFGINYFLIPARYQFTFEQPKDIFEFAIFLLVSLTINLVTSNFRDSKQLAQENAELLRVAPSAVQMGMWNWDIATGKVQWSEDHELLFGLTPGTFDGKYESFLACLHPDDRQPVNQALQQAIQGNSLYQQEFRVVWLDGSIHWIEARGHAFYTEAGQPMQITGTATAIDERKQAQGLLQQKFEQQRLVMEVTQRIRTSLNLPDILQTTVDEIRQLLECDRVVVFQFDPQWKGTVVVESVGADWTPILSTEIYDPCFGENYIEPYKQGLVTVKSDIYKAGIAPCHLQLLANFQVIANLVVPIVKGNQLWGLLIAHHCAAPRQWQDAEIDLMRQLAAQVSIALQQSELFKQVQMELAERKQSEALLREREAILRLFVRYAPAGIAMFDQDMRYVMASQRWVDEYNLGSVESVIHRSHYEIFAEIPERWRQIHQRCLAGAIEKCHDDLFIRADGREQWISWEIHPWYTATDEIGGIILFSVDSTSRKQTELTLQQLNAELEQRVAARTAELTKVNAHLLETVMEQQHTQLILLEQAQLLDLAHDTIMTRDLNTVITFWNQGAEFMYGWTKAEAFGQESHTFLHTQFPKPLADIEMEFQERGYWEGELIHTRKDGSTVIVASRWVMQKDERGRPIKVLEINNDITVQKQAEVALQEYVREIEDLYNNAPCGYHSLDASGNIIRINDTELHWLGYSRDEVLHRKFSEFVTAESQRVFQENFPQFKKRGWVKDLEFEIVTKGGVTRWLSLNGTAIKDESGNFLMSRSTMFDISDRKRAEQMSELQAVITRNMAEGICLVRVDNGVIVYANPKFEQIFGYEAGELNGRHVSIVNYTSEQVTAEDVSQAIRSAVLQNGESTYEVHNVKKDGTPFWCRATTSIFKHPEYGDVLVAVQQDITVAKHLEAVRQQAEKELRQSEAKFRSLSESSPIGIFMTDIHGQCIYTNPRYQIICGCTFDEALGDGWVKFLHPEDLATVTTEWSKAVSQRQDFSSEVRYVHKDGMIRFSQVRSAPILSVSDELIGYVGTVEDITERQAIEQMKSEFVSVVSHELRTPLSSIRGSLGLLAAGVFKNKPDAAQQMLNIAVHDTERLVRLVNDILDLERLEAQKVHLNQQWCDTAILLQQCVETLQSLATENQVVLSVQPSSIQVCVDQDRIIQTLVNVVSNAIKFSPAKATVTLRVEDQADQVLFEIKDQGRGIPADKLETVFGRFQQVDASDSRQKGGTGLGLAICKSIVLQHGGKIWAESVVGAGSCFYFTLPKLFD